MFSKRQRQLNAKMTLQYRWFAMIMINLDVMMAKRKMSLNELSEKVGITLANLSVLKNNKAKAIRFSTLDAICRALDCKVEDIMEYVED